MQEASIFVLKVAGLDELIKGQGRGHSNLTLDELLQNLDKTKSIYRTIFTGTEGDASRVGVTFAGIPDLMDREAMRLAAIADIPTTRFLAQSPAGMNATGESDMKNYAIHIASMQKRLLKNPLKRFDAILAKHAGLKEAPDFDWMPLLSMSDKDRAETSKLRTESIMLPAEMGLINEDEARERLSKDDLFGQLGPWQKPAMTEEEEEREDERMAKEIEERGKDRQAAKAAKSNNNG